MEITHCLTFSFLTFFNGIMTITKNRTLLGLPIHELVLKRHLSKHPSPFSDSAHEWYMNGITVNPLSTPIFTFVKEQSGTIIIFSSSWVLLKPLALETIHKSHFSPFLYIFYPHAQPRLWYAREWFFLI